MIARLSLLAFLWFSFVSCSWLGTREILIAVKPAVILQLITPAMPDLANTGLPSLDALNQKWKVVEMTAVYPNVSADDETAARYGLAGVFKLTVPRGTNLEAMIAEYEADPTIDYAEPNAPATIE
jgi:hypothetical protein